MKTLIVYATKYGATQKISEGIASRIDSAELHDINSNAKVSLADYDCVIIGSPLTAGMIRKEIKEFAGKNINELKSKRLGIFVSGLQESGEAEYLRKNFPPDLLAAAKAKAFLGGIFDPEKCGRLARIAIKAASKLDKYTSTIDEEKIDRFTRQLVE